MTERLYDDKVRELHELWLGQWTMDEYVAKFTSLLRYVPYIPESNSPKGKALQSSHYIFSLYNIGVTKDLFHTSLNS